MDNAAHSLADSIHLAGHVACAPIALLVNFLLFLYLVGLFYRRRREPRICLLLGCAVAGFAVLIPSAHPDRRVFPHLNAVSETCAATTFLIQITILGRDINKKMRIRSLQCLTLLGEALTVLLLAVVAVEVVAGALPGVIDWTLATTLGTVILNCALAFIFVFRFHLLAMSRGFMAVLRFGKLEIALYLLYVTSLYPFLVLDWYSGVSWAPVQALWHRLTLLACILHTVRDKMLYYFTMRSIGVRLTIPIAEGLSSI